MSLNQFIRQNRWFDTLIIAIFIMGFIGGTFTHVMDLYLGGLFPYTKSSGAPVILNIYWTSLTVFVPLVIIILVKNIRAAYLAALCIMLTDVPINLYAAANNFLGLVETREYFGIESSGFEDSGLWMQVAFLLFLLFAVRRVWRLSASNQTKPN